MYILLAVVVIIIIIIIIIIVVVVVEIMIIILEFKTRNIVYTVFLVFRSEGYVILKLVTWNGYLLIWYKYTLYMV